MNRGQAKRPVFHSRVEVRYFLSRLAREVRRGELEVHGFCCMTTHFHLLVRSSKGNLSDAMRRIENPFVRWFNRRHTRDGSLFRARFTSRRVDSDQYLRNVRRYIDKNPVAAGLVADPARYPHCSAWFFRRKTSPLWLSTSEADETATEPISDHASWVVERRLERSTQACAFDDLIGAAPANVRRWMARRARVADGPQALDCLISPDALFEAIEELRRRIGLWVVFPRRQGKNGWEVLALGLSREVVGLSTLETALRLNVPRSSAGYALLEHRRLMLSDDCYAKRAAEVLRRGLLITFGGGAVRPRAILDDRSRIELTRV